MTQIENLIETKAQTPDYSGREFTAEEIAAGYHRKFIGGNWDTHGARQFKFLTERGLRPEHTLIDIGSGCFRGGRYYIDYLDAGNYYAIDANKDLLQAGWDLELTDEQRAKVPISHIRANSRFNVSMGPKFDFAIAQSVFTHVSLNHIRLCLYRVAAQMEPGGMFYATFFEQPPETAIDQVDPNKRIFTEVNPFWYFRTDIKWASTFAPWRYRYIGGWGHPHGQMMVEFTRISDEEWAATRAPKPKKAPPPPAPVTTADKAKVFIRRGRRWAARHIAPN